MARPHKPLSLPPSSVVGNIAATAPPNAVVRLESEYQDPLLIAGFLAAEKFHKNFFHDEMEDYEIVADRPIVHRFVNRLVALVNDYEADA